MTSPERETATRLPFCVLDGLDVVQPDRPGVLDLDVVHRRRPRGGTTDVEGPHGQLGARLADRLRRDDADRLADVDPMSASQIAAVALRADAVTRLAGDRRTHHHLVDTRLLEHVDQLLVEQGPALADQIVGAGLVDVLGRHPTQDPLAQRFDHVTTLDDRLHQQTVLGAAIHLGNHQVLGHVHQATGQITGVGCLQRGIRQALTGTVGGNEVLQYIQAFAEVRRDRRLDDRAVRLGHQTRAYRPAVESAPPNPARRSRPS